MAELFKEFSPSLQQQWVAFKSIRAEAGIPQCQNLPAGARSGNKDARPFPKIALNQRRFPIEEPALSVFGGCEMLRCAVAFGSERVEIVGTQETEPESFMQSFY